ncbi:MAG: MotA/TolQ/ExbB proton channel family protein [Mucispirillum sp.]|uniref:MotA/TolQ/ExbB proton channel family protein n=1 Tax=Candidatus Mucispirillum faecigallinarum TaxID=2838699 RepID=A0A9D2GTK0_9BACT|nr:MotA/TolQ/ExbB proton channel family protein [Mucispirillum sp.]HIZ89114.1 MotA/TolQ/ExbB proton channel family protein [Candidatus Mucispirillum faecigallinarum]
MWELIQKGGITMYPIILLSVIALAVFLERLISLRKEKYVPKAFYEQLVSLLKKKNINEAVEVCKANKSALARISETIITNTDLPLSRLLEVAEESGRSEVSKLDKFLPSLQTIVAIAPLLGLLGTVLGMIKIFDVIALQGTGSAEALSSGIAEALLTTAAGLVVAIPAQIFYFIAKARADAIGAALEKASSEVMNLLFKEDEK